MSAGQAPGRYHKIGVDEQAFSTLFTHWYIDVYQDDPPVQIILDLDATDDPLHGRQEGRFFHGYYDHYCYLPLYFFAGDHLLWAELRPADMDAAAGSVEVTNRSTRNRLSNGLCRENVIKGCHSELDSPRESFGENLHSLFMPGDIGFIHPSLYSHKKPNNQCIALMMGRPVSGV